MRGTVVDTHPTRSPRSHRSDGTSVSAVDEDQRCYCQGLVNLNPPSTEGVSFVGFSSFPFESLEKPGYYSYLVLKTGVQVPSPLTEVKNFPLRLTVTSSRTFHPIRRHQETLSC